MEKLTKKEDRVVIKLIAKEILEYRLGAEPSNANISHLATHIIQFEKEVRLRRYKKKSKKNE